MGSQRPFAGVSVSTFLARALASLIFVFAFLIGFVDQTSDICDGNSHLSSGQREDDMFALRSLEIRVPFLRMGSGKLCPPLN